MSIFRQISKLLPGQAGPRGWTGIDLSPPTGVGVTVLSGPAHKRPRVKRHLVVADVLNEETALARLAEAVGQPGVPCVHALPRGSYSILVLPEPEVAATEMAESVRWSVAGQIDYPIDEANVAWMPIPTREALPNRPPHLYAMATRRTQTEEWRQAYRRAGLHLKAVDVRETAQRNISALIEPPGEGVGLLVMGHRGIEFTVTWHGELYLDRFISDDVQETGSIDFDSSQRRLERIALQVQRSLDFVQRTLPFITLREVRVGPSAEQAAMTEFLASQITVAVKPLDLGEIFDLSEVPALKDSQAQADALIALGSTLRITGAPT